MMSGKNPKLANDAKIYVAIKDCKRKCGRVLLRKGAEIIIDAHNNRSNHIRRWLCNGSLEPKIA